MTGIILRSVDQSMRVNIPKSFLMEEWGNDYSGQPVYISTEGFDVSTPQGLTVFSETAFARHNDELMELAKDDSYRMHCSDVGFERVIIDNRGRITLPGRLACIVSICKETSVYCIGVDDHFEIWNKSVWDQIEAPATIEEIVAFFQDMSI